MRAKNRLKQIRHELNIDYKTEMADLLGIRQEQYSRYERQVDQPNLLTALRIAQKLNRPVEEIFYIEPD